ncbi:hypothetical protein FHK02_2937 [Spirosoma sp. LMG 31448]|uniref:Uncharacterized protein n=1 Tax=Spirosoma utsteinense TaxID=2585773 RepID=A0ABR6WB96_9BACT|nr:hypothetical protein [Spirosoma utsteinense]MBC3793845.1 hypothetical protein [Spirosoma utsteinense]
MLVFFIIPTLNKILLIIILTITYLLAYKYLYKYNLN